LRLLVCGNRSCTGEVWELTISAWLGAIDRRARKQGKLVTLIHGGALGADEYAGEVGASLGWDVEVYPADWERYGRSAGYRRNVQMAETGLDRGLAFGRLAHDGKPTGTGGMVAILNAEGVLATIIPRPGVLP
jgi:hypothetical protein